MTATQRGSLRNSEQPPTQTQETPMLGRLACFLGFHRVITRSDKPKVGAATPKAVVSGFCYRCPFEFSRVINIREH